jgi:fibronectin type 3 domain-containing protein
MDKFLSHGYRIVCGLLFACAFFAAGSARAQGVPGGTAHSVTLAWTAPSPVGGSGTVSGYNIYRAPSSGTTYTKLITVLNAALTFTDVSVSAGASYTYCVTTVDSLGEESACSTPATANVPSDPNAPGAPIVTVK